MNRIRPVIVVRLTRPARRTMSMKNVLVAVADGCEDIETVTLIDTLRRGRVDVTVASVGKSTTVTLAHRTKLVADAALESVKPRTFDCIALPGGMPGATNLHDSATLAGMLKKQRAEKRWIAAICASPFVVLHQHGLLRGSRATCYPSFASKLPSDVRADGDPDVVISSQIVTSRGPGTATSFALSVLAVLNGNKSANDVASALLVDFVAPVPLQAA
ncbi:DJ-1/PfpI domain-containing protein [Plasmodiophora brassicae]|uniref:DJ-1/PfpI domain-containing protein n=1 Tax=Plasmodiophora brassicae TaxID=37360 RepID=A0A0G4J1L4_PLABS|nr:hypothetical protein PBRA_002013 [Plasmodiophora brassicae]SPR01425.1 unnamed protein product [Plasmodiophora brassicae]